VVVAIVTLGTFMSSFDSNAVNMALPLIQRTCRSSVATVEWVVVAYQLAVSASLLAFGRLADILGRKRLYVSGFAGFTVSSVLSVLCPTITGLIACRVIQGLCASLMMSSANAVVLGAVPVKNRGKALGAAAMAIALAACAGPALGGLLSVEFGWKSIFLVNLPIGIAGTILAAKKIKRDEERRAERFDPLGSLLVAVALCMIILSLDMVSDGLALSPLVWTLMAGGVTLVVVFLLFEARSQHPVLSVRLFDNRVFTAGNIAATFFYVSSFVMVFLAPYFLQGMRGLSPSMSGVMMLPMSLAMMIVAPLSGTLSDGFDGRWFSCGGMVILAFGETLMGRFTSTTPIWLILCSLAAIGAGLGLFQTPNNSAVMGSVPETHRGIGGTTLATMRNLGMALGEALSAALLASCMASRGFQLALGGSASAAWTGAFSFALRVTCGRRLFGVGRRNTQHLARFQARLSGGCEKQLLTMCTRAPAIAHASVSHRHKDPF
jgi:EmrB/QacA subfamily drug resistance transporter